MAAPVEEDKFRQLVRKIEPESRLVRAWDMEGGVSAQVMALEVEQPDGQRKKMVVRQHGDADFNRNPRIAAQEYRLLSILRSLGLAAQEPLYLDESGELFARPYLVVEYVEGTTQSAPSDLSSLTGQLVAYLARVHEVGSSQHDLSFLPGLDEKCAREIGQRPERLDETIGEGRIRDAVEPLWPFPRSNEPVLLHGDFWPGNVLWKDGRLVAVIDWEDAHVGDPLADLANTRLEMLWAFGLDAMHALTDRYRSITTIDFTCLPCWDLCAALRPAFKLAEWAPNSLAEQAMREKHRLFVDQALEELSRLYRYDGEVGPC